MPEMKKGGLHKRVSVQSPFIGHLLFQVAPFSFRFGRVLVLASEAMPLVYIQAHA